MPPSSNRLMSFNMMANDDFDRLLQLFSERTQPPGSSSYDEFVRVWYELGYGSLFAIRKHAHYAYEYFLVDAYFVLRQFFAKSYSFKWRLGALYVFYGLFMFEKRFPKTKMKISLSDWENISQLYEQIVVEGDQCAEYVFSSLLKSAAFQFSAMRIKYHYNELVRTSANIVPTPSSKGANVNLPLSTLRSIQSDELMAEVKEKCDIYLEMKREFLGQHDFPHVKRILSFFNEPINIQVDSEFNEQNLIGSEGGQFSEIQSGQF